MDNIHEEYQQVRNIYGNTIQQAKQEHWEAFLEMVDQKTMWTANRYVTDTSTDGGCTRIPTIMTERADGNRWTAATNEEKAKMLFETFPTTCANDHHVPQADGKYPPPAFKFTQITNKQIHRAITHISPFKSPGANGIPNVLLKQCAC